MYFQPVVISERNMQEFRYLMAGSADWEVVFGTPGWSLQP
jgi:hypothetical protein